MDPASFLLVSYGRIGPLLPSLTGRAVSWGRKGWLGLSMHRLFRAPRPRDLHIA